MQRLEVSGAVRPIYGSLGVKRLIGRPPQRHKYYHVSGGKTKDNRSRNLQNLNEIILWGVAQKKNVKNETVSLTKLHMFSPCFLSRFDRTAISR